MHLKYIPSRVARSLASTVSVSQPVNLVASAHDTPLAEYCHLYVSSSPEAATWKETMLPTAAYTFSGCDVMDAPAANICAGSLVSELPYLSVTMHLKYMPSRVARSLASTVSVSQPVNLVASAHDTPLAEYCHLYVSSSPEAATWKETMLPTAAYTFSGCDVMDAPAANICAGSLVSELPYLSVTMHLKYMPSRVARSLASTVSVSQPVNLVASAHDTPLAEYCHLYVSSSPEAATWKETMLPTAAYTFSGCDVMDAPAANICAGSLVSELPYLSVTMHLKYMPFRLAITPALTVSVSQPANLVASAQYEPFAEYCHLYVKPLPSAPTWKETVVPTAP